MTDDPKFPSQLAERFQIRMPDGLRDRLRSEAEASGRSMNAEIVHRLEQSFSGDPRVASLEQAVERLESASMMAQRIMDAADQILRLSGASSEMLEQYQKALGFDRRAHLEDTERGAFREPAEAPPTDQEPPERQPASGKGLSIKQAQKILENSPEHRAKEAERNALLGALEEQGVVARLKEPTERRSSPKRRLNIKGQAKE